MKNLKIQGRYVSNPLWLKMFVIAFWGLFGLLVGSILGVCVSFLFEDRECVQAVQWNQFVVSVFTFVLPALICGKMFSEPNSPSYFRDDKLPSLGAVMCGILSLIFFIPVINMLTWWNEQMVLPDVLQGIEVWMREMEDLAKSITEEFLLRDTVGGFLQNLLFLALIPAVCEELFFRGTIQRTMENYLNSHAAVWITAIVFSAFHLQFYGFIPRMVLGALLGYLYLWSKSLYLPILVHFCNNAMVVVVSYIFLSQVSESEIETIGTAEDWSSAVFGLILGMMSMYMLYKTTKNEK